MVDDLEHHLVVGIPFERAPAGQALVQNDAEGPQIGPVIDVLRAGDPFLYSPETSASLALLYDRPLNETYGLRSSLNGRWQSDSSAGNPDDPFYDIDSYGTLNGSIGLYTLNDTWEFSLWGQNLTDEYYITQVTTNANVVLRYAGKPRTYGASLSYRF